MPHPTGSLSIKESSVMSKTEGRNLVNFIILGDSTVLMKRRDLGAGGVTDKECRQQQQMGDLVLLINSFPFPLPFHTPSLDFIFESKILTPAKEGIISTAKPWENAASGQSTGAQPDQRPSSSAGWILPNARPGVHRRVSWPQLLRIGPSAGPSLLSRLRHYRWYEPRWLRK